MFTGIVQSTGVLASSRPQAGGADARLHIESDGLDAAALSPGDSVCVSGVCLTVTGCESRGFTADVSGETLRLTTLGGLAPGDAVNLEPALRLDTPLGGHLVSGHVDGVATVRAIEADGRSVRMEIDAPAALSRYVAVKGSVCLDGVSLTVNAVDGARFAVNLIPHTLGVTTLGTWAAGRAVNIEVDIVARYLERLLGDRGTAR